MCPQVGIKGQKNLANQNIGSGGRPGPDDGAEEAVDQQQLGKLALEVGPLVVFFVTNSQLDIYWGTGAFMVATIIALSLSKALFGRIPLMPLISGVFVLSFGGLTLYLHDALFIKLKPTIVNSLFAAILFGGLLFGHSLLRYLFGDVFRLTDKGWRILTFRWALFFVFLAVLNEIVWRNFSDDFWVNFKLFGVIPITMIFGIMQFSIIKRYEDKEPAS